MVSHDSVAIDGETSVHRHERETRNIDRQRHRNEEDIVQAAEHDSPPLACNLQHEFLMVDNQQVEQTSSANLAVATHELA